MDGDLFDFVCVFSRHFTQEQDEQVDLEQVEPELAEDEPVDDAEEDDEEDEVDKIRFRPPFWPSVFEAWIGG